MNVSVIIPVFNRAQMLKRAVSSVLEQSYQDFELIVVDDGSTDDLSEIQKTVESSGHRFLSLAQNSGVAAARNCALTTATGTWIALLDSDDCWLPNKLLQQIEYHSAHPQYLLSQCEERWFRNEKLFNPRRRHLMPVGDAFSKSLELCCISSSSVLIHSSIYQELGFYDERMRVCEDYDLWLRVTNKYAIGLVPGPLVEKYGGHPDQLSKSTAALDKFRLYSLLKLVLTENLSAVRMRESLSWIAKRAEILEKGASKRNDSLSLLYCSIFDTSRLYLSNAEMQFKELQASLEPLFQKLIPNL
ncbi:MAG: glycosyltransferase family 2 protein [Deltaproteobacteria bacterium]|nr:glycosyltransferase family 2 protein [Deltaproteobacteria bacterium]